MLCFLLFLSVFYVLANPFIYFVGQLVEELLAFFWVF
jgi:hypothetical protein